MRNFTSAANKTPDIFLQSLRDRTEIIKESNVRINALLRSYLPDESLPKVFPRIVKTKKGLPLFGSTFAVKDNIRVKNQPLTFGLLPPLEGPAEQHAKIVEQLIKKGATLIGSTNMDAACLDFYGNNPYYGKVINPKFRDCVPAGSSSGSAAAVAASFADFSLGTDFGGSVRAPAAACSVYGLKLSTAIAPGDGVLLISQEMDSIGLFTSILDDLQFLLENLSCQDSSDAGDQNFQFLVPTFEELEELDSEIEKDFEFLLNKLRGSYNVHRMDFNLGFAESIDIRKIIAASEFLELSKKLEIDLSTLDSVKAIMAFERLLKPNQKENAQDRRRVIKQTIRTLLEKNTFILTPTLPARPPSWSSLQQGREALPSKRINRFLALANLCSLPALSMPLEDTLSKFPFSLQIISAENSDCRLLAAAKAIKECVWPK